MPIYKLDVEKKFGQLRFRLHPQGEKAPDFGSPVADMKALLAALDGATADLDLKIGGDSVIFRGIEYDEPTALRETVRLSRY